MRCLPTLLLAGCVLLGAARADDLSAAFDDCLARLGSAPGQGVEQVRRLCPDLEWAIQQLPLAQQLPERWQARLDRSAILDLRALQSRYGSPPPSSAPSVATLQRVVHGLQTAPDQVSLWQSFKDWLRDLLLPQSQPGPPWLAGWLPHLSVPSWLARSITYLLLGAVIVIAGWILRRELLAAALGGGRSRRGARFGHDVAAEVPGAALDLSSIDAAPLQQQPALLLRLLVQTLAHSGRLTDERSLTHRELGLRGVFDHAEQRSTFVRLAQLAERLLYGPAAAEPAAAPIEPSVNDARRLYGQLTALRGGRP
jgi:hypothetical protein